MRVRFSVFIVRSLFGAVIVLAAERSILILLRNVLPGLGRVFTDGVPIGLILVVMRDLLGELFVLMDGDFEAPGLWTITGPGVLEERDEREGLLFTEGLRAGLLVTEELREGLLRLARGIVAFGAELRILERFVRTDGVRLCREREGLDLCIVLAEVGAVDGCLVLAGVERF